MSDTVFHLNGKIVPEEQALIPATDRGFLYGDGLFETLHVYGAHPFRLNEHLDRMAKGFDVLQLEGAPNKETLTKYVKETIAHAKFPETNIRITVTRGSGPRGPSAKGPFKPTIVVMATLFTRRPESDYRNGVAAVLASFRRQESSVAAGLKTTNYLEQILAKREADAAGADEALLLNNSGMLCEGSASNITLIRNGTLLVPNPKLVGALPGTGQLVAMELARKLRIPILQGLLGPFDLKDCEEAFLSGSMREITPLVKVDKNPIGSGKPGPITTRLIQAYRELVVQECPDYSFPK